MDLTRALAERVRADGAAPLVTFHDLATGERAELSALSVQNAIAKTAGLLRDELDVEPGDAVAVHLPLHWQAVVWLGACAAVGATAWWKGDGGACVATVTTREEPQLLGRSREDIIVSLEPFGLPSREPLPLGAIDHAVAARAHPDVFTAYDAADPDAALLVFSTPEGARRSLTSGDYIVEAQRRAQGSSASSKGSLRVLVTDDAAYDLVDLLGVPLALGGSAVLVRHAQDRPEEVARIAAAEGCAPA